MNCSKRRKNCVLKMMGSNVRCSVARSNLTLCHPMDRSAPGSSVHRIFQNGVGCHFLLRGIFLTQGLNPSLLRLLHWLVDSLRLRHLGSPHSCSFLPHAGAVH